MTGVVRKATLLVVLGLVAATTAMAGIPNPAHSTVPLFFDVYACKNSLPDPLNALNPKYGFVNKVTINDIGGFPVVNCAVSLEFCGDIKLYNAVPGHPEQVVACDAVTGLTTITVITDAFGVAQFYLVGSTINFVPGGNNIGQGGHWAGTTDCVKITACGVPMGNATATCFDQNGVPGVKYVDPGDFSCLLSDLGNYPTRPYMGRGDYNHVNGPEPGDMSVLIYVLGQTNSSQTCGTLCGGPTVPRP